ncbi:MAG: response regulator [Spirochaetia bacterium]|nr:response regulator [Spirochaetia bacterium]
MEQLPLLLLTRFSKNNDSELQQGSLPGDYVLLSIKDSGSGIPGNLLRQIFEPFFTTKASGKGTGLGLSIVHGIVEQHGGFIRAASKAGSGSDFRIYFPRSAECKTIQPLSSGLHKSTKNRGTETILVVEYEQAILHIIKTILTKYGYKIFASASPEEALAQVKNNPDAFDLLITDVIMPGMNGSDLFKAVRTCNSSINCLFISGYTADIISGEGHDVPDSEINLLQKPFSSSDLCLKVRELLDS